MFCVRKRHARLDIKFLPLHQSLDGLKIAMEGDHVYGLVWVDNAYMSNKGILQPRCLKTMVLPMGEDEFKFLEEDPSTSLGVKRFMREEHKCLNDS